MAYQKSNEAVDVRHPHAELLSIHPSTTPKSVAYQIPSPKIPVPTTHVPTISRIH